MAWGGQSLFSLPVQFKGHGNSFHGEGGRGTKVAQLRQSLRLLLSMCGSGDDAVIQDLHEQGAIPMLLSELGKAQCCKLAVLSVRSPQVLHLSAWNWHGQSSASGDASRHSAHSLLCLWNGHAQKGICLSDTNNCRLPTYKLTGKITELLRGSFICKR